MDLLDGCLSLSEVTLAESLTRTALNATSAVAPGFAGRVSFFLFRNPIRRGKVRDEEHEVHQRAVTGELSVNGKTVITYRWGDGTRPVLLLHGWQSRASRYAGFVPALQALGLSPVSFDAPGHGDSGGRATTILEYRDIIRQLQDRYGPFDAVIAHSFGVAAAFLALRQVLAAGRLVGVARGQRSGPSPTKYKELTGRQSVGVSLPRRFGTSVPRSWGPQPP